MPWQDDDSPDEEWVEDDGDEEGEILSCPSCGGSVHEDAQQCPHCGDWITPVDTRGAWKHWIWIAAVILLVSALAIIAVL